MNRVLPVIFAVALLALVALGSVGTGRSTSANNPEGAVRAFFERVQARDWNGAHGFLLNQSANRDHFAREVGGRDGSLRAHSSLQNIETRVLRQDDREGVVRATLRWSSPVGAYYETRDVRAVQQEGRWRIDWAVAAPPRTPPQVIPINYLRWDIVRAPGSDEWGAQNVEAPRVRITSMNAIERDGAVVIVGEVVNEDTVPGFVAINATLIGQDDQVIGEESSFDKINHTLLPKEVTPFRIDFPGLTLAEVKNVRIQPNSALVPASAEPTIAVLNQRIEEDGTGNKVLRGELVNQSGQIVEIPHVLATYYDRSGRVVWVSDGYVDRALYPQVAVPFSVAMRDEEAANIQNYRVTVNHYSRERRQ